MHSGELEDTSRMYNTINIRDLMRATSRKWKCNREEERDSGRRTRGLNNDFIISSARV